MAPRNSLRNDWRCRAPYGLVMQNGFNTQNNSAAATPSRGCRVRNTPFSRRTNPSTRRLPFDHGGFHLPN